jgi:hypothetical protein
VGNVRGRSIPFILPILLSRPFFYFNGNTPNFRSSHEASSGLPVSRQPVERLLASDILRSYQNFYIIKLLLECEDRAELFKSRRNTGKYAGRTRYLAGAIIFGGFCASIQLSKILPLGFGQQVTTAGVLTRRAARTGAD